MFKYLFSNKVHIKLIGGLGNQLFIYAFGIAISEKFGKKLVIDNISGFSKSDIYRAESCLEDFKINDTFLTNSIYKYLIGNRYFWFLVKKLNLCKIESDPYKYDLEAINSHFPFFFGYWQSYLYFNKYKDKIKDSLEIKNPENNETIEYKNQILKSKNPVAIGMRFYDDHTEYDGRHKVYQRDYYESAIKLIKSKKKNVTIFVFSLNIKRAKKIFSFYTDDNLFFIDPQLGYTNAKFDMYLMSLCKHFIISNSSMYWWAAYLGEDNKSIVIVPKDGIPHKKNLLPHWFKI